MVARLFGRDPSMLAPEPLWSTSTTVLVALTMVAFGLGVPRAARAEVEPVSVSMLIQAGGQTTGIDLGTSAQTPVQMDQDKVYAASPAQEDMFGRGVATDDGTLIVGSLSGVEFLTRDFASWSSQRFDGYALSVAVRGDRAAAGTYQNVRVFSRSGGSWSEGTPVVPSSNDWRGWALAMDDALLVSGDPGGVIGGSGPVRPGSVSVFTMSSTGWTERVALQASVPTPWDHFGEAVAVDDGTIVVGAPGEDGGGAVYVFTGAGAAWSLQARLSPASVDSGDGFGRAVAVDGDMLLAGAPWTDQGRGALYVFTRTGTSWSQVGKIAAPATEGVAGLGNAVAAANGEAVVGAWLSDEAGAGAGAVYRLSGLGRMTPQPRLVTAYDAAPGDHFGAAVAISEEAVAVGAPEAAGPIVAGTDTTWAGAVYLTEWFGCGGRLEVESNTGQRVDAAAPAFTASVCSLTPGSRSVVVTITVTDLTTGSVLPTVSGNTVTGSQTVPLDGSAVLDFGLNKSLEEGTPLKIEWTASESGSESPAYVATYTDYALASADTSVVNTEGFYLFIDDLTDDTSLDWDSLDPGYESAVVTSDDGNLKVMVLDWSMAHDATSHTPDMRFSPVATDGIDADQLNAFKGSAVDVGGGWAMAAGSRAGMISNASLLPSQIGVLSATWDVVYGGDRMLDCAVSGERCPKDAWEAIDLGITMGLGVGLLTALAIGATPTATTIGTIGLAYGTAKLGISLGGHSLEGIDLEDPNDDTYYTNSTATNPNPSAPPSLPSPSGFVEGVNSLVTAVDHEVNTIACGFLGGIPGDPAGCSQPPLLNLGRDARETAAATAWELAGMRGAAVPGADDSAGSFQVASFTNPTTGERTATAAYIDFQVPLSQNSEATETVQLDGELSVGEGGTLVVTTPTWSETSTTQVVLSENPANVSGDLDLHAYVGNQHIGIDPVSGVIETNVEGAFYTGDVDTRYWDEVIRLPSDVPDFTAIVDAGGATHPWEQYSLYVSTVGDSVTRSAVIHDRPIGVGAQHGVDVRVEADGSLRLSADPTWDSLGLVDVDTGRWYLRGSDGSITSFYYGVPGDRPLMGDWDCDGTDTPGMYRSSDGFVYLRNSNSTGIADIRFHFGIAGDLPMAGDWDGDGCDTIGIFRRGHVYVSNTLGQDGGWFVAENDYWFGVPGDSPFTGDFSGDGHDTVGLYRESTGFVYFTLQHGTGGGIVATDDEFFFGIPDDVVTAGDWTGDGSDTVAVFRPTDTPPHCYSSYENRSKAADEVIQFGQPGWMPVAGAWNG